MDRRDDLHRASEELDHASDHTVDAAHHLKEAGRHTKDALEAGASGLLERTKETAKEAGRAAGQVAEHLRHAQPDRELEHRADSATESALDTAGGALRRSAPTVGRGVETVIGATGSALHAAGGALGLIAGKIAGRIGGWWDAAAQQLSEFPPGEEQACLVHFEAYELRPADLDFETARTAYLLGYLAAENPGYRDRDFATIESDLSHGFSGESTAEFNALRDFTRFGYERARIIRPSQDGNRVEIH
jgi:hypothetical protein